MTKLLLWIKEMDWMLFDFINNKFHFSFLDVFFRTITDLHKLPSVKYGVFPLLVLASLWWAGRRALKAVIVLGLVLAFCDLFNHRVVKPFFARPRPFLAKESSVNLRLSYRPGGYSFPSSHAENTMASAVLLSAYIPALGPILIPYSLLVGYSRPYLGVHFPTDILMGWLLGGWISWITLFCLKKWFPSWAPKSLIRKKGFH